VMGPVRRAGAVAVLVAATALAVCPGAAWSGPRPRGHRHDAVPEGQSRVQTTGSAVNPTYGNPVMVNKTTRRDAEIGCRYPANRGTASVPAGQQGQPQRCSWPATQPAANSKLQRCGWTAQANTNRNVGVGGARRPRSQPQRWSWPATPIPTATLELVLAGHLKHQPQRWSWHRNPYSNANCNVGVGCRS